MIGNSQTPDQMGYPIFGKESVKSQDMDWHDDDAITNGDSLGKQLQLGPQSTEMEDEADCSINGRLVDDGTDNGGVVWVGGTDDEADSGTEGIISPRHSFSSSSSPSSSASASQSSSSSPYKFSSLALA